MKVTGSILRNCFILVFSLLLCSCSFALKPKQNTATIVKNGQPRACIVQQADAPKQLKEAVREMRKLIKRASGADLPIVSEPQQGTISIHIGRTTFVKRQNIDLGNLDADGFVIRFPDENNILILGPSDWGTEFGIYEFLERYLGVRWLMPGPDGTYVPTMDTIQVLRNDLRDEPAFFSRKFFGLCLPEQRLWARRNRLHSRIEFHHNLFKLFPYSDEKNHPEFFPVIDGKRYFPAREDYISNWQPCFTAPGIVDTAIKRIVQYFDEHPEAVSFSLGVNDGRGHCQCKHCCALDANRKNMIGRDHLSDRYITWANAVVEGVLKHHPDKWFGFLAYSEIFEPPDVVKLHPRLIPYMTYDRMQWIDADIRSQSENLTKKWAQLTSTVGWSDYIYGAAYLVPRVYPHLMADYYRFGYNHGVRVQAAEAYPNFGEGPKLYTSLKLQWDPFLNVDDLLDEWYTLSVGTKATPYIRSYYDHWEDFWTRRITKSDWWNMGRQYLPFSSPRYLNSVSEDEIKQSRNLLETALSEAGTEDQKARAKLLLKAFEYYEASAIAYPKIPTLGLSDEADAKSYIDRIIQRADMAKKRHRLSKEEFNRHPFLHHCTSIDRHRRISSFDWVASDKELLWPLLDWVSRGESRKKRSKIAHHIKSQGSDCPKAILNISNQDITPFNSNASFEDGQGPIASDFKFWLQDGVGALTRSPAAARTGGFGLIADGVQYGGPYQNIDLKIGHYCLVASLYIPGSNKNGYVELALRMLDGKNSNLPHFSKRSIQPISGHWVTTAACIDATELPKNAKRLRMGVWARNFQKDEMLYIDNIRLFYLPDE